MCLSSLPGAPLLLKRVPNCWFVAKLKKKEWKLWKLWCASGRCWAAVCLSSSQMDKRTAEPIKKSLLAPHPPSNVSEGYHFSLRVCLQEGMRQEEGQRVRACVKAILWTQMDIIKRTIYSTPESFGNLYPEMCHDAKFRPFISLRNLRIATSLR